MSDVLFFGFDQLPLRLSRI